MLRSIAFSAVLALAATPAITFGAAAQSGSPYVTRIDPATGQPRRVPGAVEANGRCNGISYGTGARRCGTRSGGPVGGISGRN